MLQVTSPPVAANLTTVNAACAELGLQANSSRMTALIAQASAACENFAGRSFARTGFAETFFGTAYPLVLAATPVVALASVTEGDTALETTAYMLDTQSGVIFREAWPCGFLGRITVCYTAGFLLPGQEGRDLPADVERACLEVMKALWFNGGGGNARDPAIRSESVEGIGSTSYLDPRSGNGGLPELAAALLRPYQRLAL